MSYRLGIIGAGGIAAVHAEAASHNGIVIAGFCDVDEGKAGQLAAQYPGALATTSVEELLDDERLDAVVVAAPNYLHKSLALAVLQAGKDLLLEKPMAMNVTECDEILNAAQQSAQIVQINFVTRQSPAARAAFDLIQAGRLGRIYHIKAVNCRRRGIPGLGRWFTTKSQSGGGVLIDLGVHLIDLALHLTGRPRVRSVSGACACHFGHPIGSYLFTEMWAGPPDAKGVCDVEDTATAMIRFEDGMVFELHTAWAANLPEASLPNGVLVLGDKGGCYFDPWGRRVTLATEQDGYLVDVMPQLPPGDAWPMAWRRQHELFAESVLTRTPPVSTAEHGREVQLVLDAVYQSSEEGREIVFGE